MEFRTVDRQRWKLLRNRDLINSPKTNYSCLWEETAPPPLCWVCCRRVCIAIQTNSLQLGYNKTYNYLNATLRLHIIRSTYIGHNSRLNIIGKRIAKPLTNALLNAHDEYVRNEYTSYLLDSWMEMMGRRTSI